MSAMTDVFKNKVMSRIIEHADGCWTTDYPTDRYGYRHLYFAPTGKTRVTHRVVYEYLVGPIPDGLVLDHLCKVRDCVNPDHLEPVTQRENLMRSPTFQAKNAAKTTCPKGHVYDYFYTTKQGHQERMCKTCMNESTRRSNAKRTAESRLAWRLANPEKIEAYNERRRQKRAADRLAKQQLASKKDAQAAMLASALEMKEGKQHGT